MGRGVGSGAGRPKGAKNKPIRPQTLTGVKRTTGWDTVPGVASAGTRGGGSAGGISGMFGGGNGARTGHGQTVARDDEAFDEVDTDSEDEGEETDYIKDGPLLEAVKKAVTTTLPKVVGQRREGALNTNIWKDYKYRMPLATLSNEPRDPGLHIVRKCLVIAPHEFHGDAAGAICCVKCGCAARVRVHGWSRHLRVFNKLDKKTYAYSRVYKCVFPPNVA